jgi:exopolysaccharide production protein ExoF
LRAKSDTQEKQQSLVDNELRSVNALIAKGLSVTARQLPLQQTLLQLQAGSLDLNLSIVRAQQDLAKADRDMLDLRNRRQSEVLTEMRQVQAKLAEISAKSSTSERLVYDAEVRAPQQLQERLSEQSARPTFSIVRLSDGTPREIQAEENTGVEPGDVIKVRVALQESISASASGDNRTQVPQLTQSGSPHSPRLREQ